MQFKGLGGSGRSVKEVEAQREAERRALRKIRKALDGIEQGENEQRWWRRKVLIVCAALLVFGSLLLLGLFLAGKEVPRGAPIQVPEKISPKPA